jgi:hypothetical protein
MPEGVYLKVLYPGYRPGEVQVPAGSLQEDIKLEPLNARALYLEAAEAGSHKHMSRYFDYTDCSFLRRSAA